MGERERAMSVTHLELELSYEGRRLRGFTCKLTRCAQGYVPETAAHIAAQVLLPYLLAGLGMVGAGMLMDTVQVCMPLCLCPIHSIL